MVDADVALSLRRDLARLARRHEALRAALTGVREAATPAEARRLAFELGLDFPGVAGLGELASREGDAREELLMAAADTEEARAAARTLVEATLTRGVFRALHGVFPASFRSPMLEAEQRYRASLKELPKRTVWPGSPVTLGDVYVPPACELYLRQDFETWGGEPQGRRFEDPLEALRFWLRDHPTENLTLVGDNGSGKSTVCTMLAVALADDPAWLPVVLSDGKRASLLADLARLLTGESSPPPWFDLEALPRLVVFDDNASGPRRYIATRLGLTVFTTPSRALDPREAPVLELAPFDDGRARRWAARWNDHVSAPFDVEGLLTDAPQAEVLSWRPTTSPFALLMLAQMQGVGRVVRGGAVLLDRAALYRELISWSCELAAAADGQGTKPAVAREELRQMAVRAQRQSARLFSVRRFERFTVDRPSPWLSKTDAAARFPLVSERGGYSFFHESFAEYLIAERVAFESHRLAAFATDVAGDAALAGDAGDLARRWLMVFGVAPLEESMEALLRVMIPTWQSFVLGKRRTPGNFAASWSKVVAAVYGKLSDDSSWRIVVDVAESLQAEPSRIKARAVDALLRLGGLIDASTRVPFAPEKVLRGSIVPMLGWLRTQATALSARSYEGVVSLVEASLVGADLAGVDLAGIDLSRATLREANLRGADLRRCNLTGADLRRASLAGATVDGAEFDGAALIDAQVDGCNITDAQRRAAIWTREVALARGVALAAFDDDIPF